MAATAHAAPTARAAAQTCATTQFMLQPLTSVHVLQSNEGHRLLVIVAPSPLRRVLQHALVFDQSQRSSQTCTTQQTYHMWSCCCAVG
jgi:hypothetical protein